MWRTSVFTVRFHDGAGQSIAILESDLVCEECDESAKNANGIKASNLRNTTYLRLSEDLLNENAKLGDPER